MTKAPHTDLLELWCREAVQEFGDDWARIHGHVQRKLAELPELERRRLLQGVSLALAPLDSEPH